jgi:CHASE3 domain sensor protein
MITLRRPIAIALLGLVVAGAAAWLRLGAMVDAQRPAAHAHRVLAEVSRLGLVADATDRAQRAFLAGRDPAAYRTYRDTAAVLDRTVASVAALTVADPVQQRIAADIRTEVRQSGVVNADRDRRFGRVSALAGAMHDHESATLDRMLRDGTASAQETRALVVGLIAAAGLLLAAAWWTARGRPAARPEPDAAAAGRADVERHFAEAQAEVRGALVGSSL